MRIPFNRGKKEVRFEPKTIDSNDFGPQFDPSSIKINDSIEPNFVAQIAHLKPKSIKVHVKPLVVPSPTKRKPFGELICVH